VDFELNLNCEENTWYASTLARWSTRFCSHWISGSLPGPKSGLSMLSCNQMLRPQTPMRPWPHLKRSRYQHTNRETSNYFKDLERSRIRLEIHLSFLSLTWELRTNHVVVEWNEIEIRPAQKLVKWIVTINLANSLIQRIATSPQLLVSNEFQIPPRLQAEEQPEQRAGPRRTASKRVPSHFGIVCTLLRQLAARGSFPLQRWGSKSGFCAWNSI
jgi:hypothetical protein